ncbi:unnamed protein product, partial [Mesorhabditis spiculigera]
MRKCPVNWILAGPYGKCYLPVHEPANYVEAEKRCKAMNAELLTIDSIEEDYYVLNLQIGDGSTIAIQGS